jgi:hypothetical protein
MCHKGRLLLSEFYRRCMGSFLVPNTTASPCTSHATTTPYLSLRQCPSAYALRHDKRRSITAAQFPLSISIGISISVALPSLPCQGISPHTRSPQKKQVHSQQSKRQIPLIQALSLTSTSRFRSNLKRRLPAPVPPPL